MWNDPNIVKQLDKIDEQLADERQSYERARAALAKEVASNSKWKGRANCLLALSPFIHETRLALIKKDETAAAEQIAAVIDAIGMSVASLIVSVPEKAAETLALRLQNTVNRTIDTINVMRSLSKGKGRTIDQPEQ